MSIFAIKKWIASKAVVLAMFVLFGALTAGVSLAYSHADSTAPTATDTSSTTCGETGPTPVIDGGVCSMNDLQHDYQTMTYVQEAYAANPFHITAADMQAFAKNYQVGQVYATAENGFPANSVVVNGKVVGTDAETAGRTPASCDLFSEKLADGLPLYVRQPTCSFLANPLTAYVYMPNGVFQFAVLTSCGNPVTAKPVTPPPPPPIDTCNALDFTLVPDQREIKVQIHISEGNGAKFRTVLYQWGDGTQEYIYNTGPWQHFYHNGFGPFTVTTTVIFIINGKDVPVTSPNCVARNISFPKPVAQCTDLDATTIGKPALDGDQEYQLTATSTATNGAEVTAYTYDFHDGSKEVTNKTGDTTNSTTHTYTPGNHEATVDVSFNVDGQPTSSSCQVAIPVPPAPTFECSNLVADKVGEPELNGDQKYNLIATAAVKNGAKVVSYVYDFQDGSAIETVNTDALSATVPHTYTPGNHQANVVVNFDANGHSTSDSCQVSIPVAPAPIYQCSDLSLAPVTTELKTVEAVVTYKVANGAKFKSATFDWGKGIKETTVTKSSKNQASAEHTYANFGTKTVEVTLTFDVNGQTVSVKPDKNCSRSITFAIPSAACTQLLTNDISGEQLGIQATVDYTLQNGSVFKSATFDWGDSSSTTVNTSSNNQATADHIYSTFGTYTITASLVFTINGVSQQPVSSAACQVQKQFTAPPTPTPMCTIPGETNLPANSSQCVTPTGTTLVNTGPGDDAAIFGGATAIGTLGHYLIRSRKLFSLWSAIARR